MSAASNTGFVRARAGQLIDGAGRRLLLRGVGLGNWLVPEGYMWKFEPPGPQSGRRIEALFKDLVGPERASQFWARFRDVFITEADIAAIAREGFDHVRLPLNARFLIDDNGLKESGFTRVDTLIEWCRVHNLWVILDLHAAPGGQTGTNIDDSPRGLPELFVHDHFQQQTIELWRAIAARYADVPTVAGYDLLNEPLPNEFQHRYARELVDLYLTLTQEIRAVDQSHLIIYEGSHWATNWTMFDTVWDENSMLQFHKYWSPPDRPSIQRFIDVGTRLELPIYMGEGGENNVGWLQTAFELYESYDISWNLWPWKKMDTATSPVSVRPPGGWSRIVDYAKTGADRPDPDWAWGTMCELLERFGVEHCDQRPDVLNACFRRAPLTLPATGFGFGGRDVSYSTAAVEPLVGFRNDDAVTIRHGVGDEPETLNFFHNTGSQREQDEQLAVVLGESDWVAYTFASDTSPLCVEVDADGPVRLWLDGAPLPATNVAGTRFAGQPRQRGLRKLRLAAAGRSVTVRAIDVRLGRPS
jgi:endoglucanase